MPLVKHAFARVAPAIFVVFARSEQQSLVLMVRERKFVIFAVPSKPLLFDRGQRHGPKGLPGRARRAKKVSKKPPPNPKNRGPT